MITNPLIVRAARLYAMWARLVSYLQCLLLLAIRLYWGWQFFQTGKGKLGHLDRTANYFATLHIPMPKVNAVMAGSAECFCGMLLLLGLGARLTTIPLICTMIVAYLTADSDKLHAIFSDPDKFVTADPFLFLYAAVIVLVFGPGRLSLDGLIGWLVGRQIDDPLIQQMATCCNKSKQPNNRLT